MRTSYTWHFGGLGSYAGLWLGGVKETLELTGAVVTVGTALALLLVAGLRSRSRVWRVLARVYVNLFRSIPALVLLGTAYFCVPMLSGFRISPFQTAFLALSLNLAPFAAECIRGAVESLSPIQYDSAQVLGLTAWQRKRYVTGPQIVRRALPSLLGQYITTLKLTSLAATIGVSEIWHVTGIVISATSLPLEARLVGAGLYAAIVLPFIGLSSFVERRLESRGFGLLAER